MIGVAGVGCIQLCCAIRGSVFIADVTIVVVEVKLVDNDVLTPTMLVIDVPLLLSCTGG